MSVGPQGTVWKKHDFAIYNGQKVQIIEISLDVMNGEDMAVITHFAQPGSSLHEFNKRVRLAELKPWTFAEVKKQIASVDPITPDRAWSAKGAAGDALQRVGHKDAFIAVWIDSDGRLTYTKANTNGATLSTFAVFILELAQRCARAAFREQDGQE